MLMACATSTHLSPTIPANLIVPCPKLLKLESGQGKEITLWIIDTVAKYNECSALNDVKNKALN
ncbi:hypothetical protein P7L54_14145 [Acinetobacter bereziniae]|nr:hypothetical protein [Acinetobacter bereziniae]MDG3557088.1 hypothetical protein [Acinetobacter bereziniae]UUN94886.1 hypothetical protein I9189_006825 [Acinetobacter bereziniae]